MPPSSPAVLQSYRSLLRTISQTFQGDTVALTEGRLLARSQYLEQRHVSDPEEVKKLLAAAEEAREFLKESVVQAKLNEKGNYEVTLANRKETVLENPDISQKE